MCLPHIITTKMASLLMASLVHWDIPLTYIGGALFLIFTVIHAYC